MTGAWRKQARLILAFFVGLLIFTSCGLPTPFVSNPSQAAQYLVADDSMITFRVAANIAAKHGPYFNVGERTAANTSLFWPYCISPFFRLFPDRGQSVLALAIFSSLLCALTSALTAFWANSWLAALSAAATLFALPLFPVYGNSAWEHIPQALLVTLAFSILTGRIGMLVEARYPAALSVLAVAFWIRPDTLPLFLPLTFVMLRDRTASSRWLTYISIGFVVSMVIAYFGLHHHLYGLFVPNTYYLKVNPGTSSVIAGTLYVLRSSLNSGVVPFVLMLPVLCWARRENFSREELAVVAAMMLQTIYICLIGGDAFRYGRFFILLGPFAILLFWEKFWHGTAAASVRLLTATFCLAGLFSTYVLQNLRSTEEHVLMLRQGTAVQMPTLATQEASMASYLRRYIQPADGQIGLFTLGALAYYLPEYTVADFLGKADSEIAHEPVKWGTVGHNKWDIEHTLRDRHVSVVPFSPLPDEEARLILQTRRDFAFSAALQLSPYTAAHYTYRTWQQLGLLGNEGLLIRNDLLPRFPAHSD